MATNNASTERPEPSKELQLRSMIDEIIKYLAQCKAENQQLQEENQYLKKEWEQAFLRLEQNNTTIRMLSDQKNTLETKNGKLIEEAIKLRAREQRCPHKHQ